MKIQFEEKFKRHEAKGEIFKKDSKISLNF